jgi:hypothetical protein
MEDWKEIEGNLPEGEKHQFVGDTEGFSHWDFFLSPQYSKPMSQNRHQTSTTV